MKKKRAIFYAYRLSNLIPETALVVESSFESKVGDENGRIFMPKQVGGFCKAMLAYQFSYSMFDFGVFGRFQRDFTQDLDLEQVGGELLLPLLKRFVVYWHVDLSAIVTQVLSLVYISHNYSPSLILFFAILCYNPLRTPHTFSFLLRSNLWPALI